MFSSNSRGQALEQESNGIVVIAIIITLILQVRICKVPKTVAKTRVITKTRSG